MRPVFERLDELGIAPGLRDDSSAEDDSLIKELEAIVAEFHQDNDLLQSEITSVEANRPSTQTKEEDKPSPITPPLAAFPEAQNPMAEWMLGSRVSHSIMGYGTVVGREGEGDNTKLTIRFDDIGVKKLAAKYANLKHIS